MTIDPKKTYKATLKTQKGDIVIQLFADKAPVTVNSFVFLTKEGFYNGVTFHRVITDFVAQTGDPFGTGVGGPGYRIKNEIDPSLTFGEEGVVGMANSGADTNGSQFFITYKGIPADVVKKLDGNYTIFGKVESGMDVVKKLTPRDPQQNPNAPAGDAIESIEITEQ
ncbi:MAG: peptidylprolyl isomerase [Chloroflexota bacterium]